MEVSVIGNPVAGGGRAKSLIEELVGRLRARGYRIEPFLTRAPGDARRYVEQTDGAWSALLVVGGDGTLNEVVNGLRRLGSTPVGFLPAGTGNVVACELGLSRDPEALVQALERQRIKKVDVGRAGSRRFLMLASAGFDALVTEEVARRRRGTFARTHYVGPILQVLRQYRPPEILVQVDGGKPLRAGLVVASKTPFYGGIFKVDTAARCDSGLFHVCVFSSGKIADLAKYFLAAATNSVRALRDVRFLAGKTVKIDSDPPTAFELDGDYAGRTPVDLELEKRTLPFLVTRGRRGIRR